jgi:hypothetical protein
LYDQWLEKEPMKALRPMSVDESRTAEQATRALGSPAFIN